MSNQITFDKFKLSSPILGALEKKGFKVASEIQGKVIPIALEDKHDIIGIAQTGTGKTAAFGLPILEKLSDETKSNLPKAIILAPTRELAIQVCEELKTYTGTKKVRILTVYGGQAIGPQIKDLTRGVDIVVGTPGRVLDLLNRNNLNLKEVENFVLDEADEMLKMGFIEDIEQILEASSNKDKRVFLFSATMPDRIKNLSKKYMKNQKVIEISKQEATTNLISQVFYVLKQSERFDALKKIIDAENFFYGIVFCRTKADVDDITNRLRKDGYDADSIHGDIIQSKRERILNKFKDQKINILVATDVAARGIDVDSLTHVVNYTLPKETETYVHRIGRTGRAGKNGIAISFVTSREKVIINELEKLTKSKFTVGKLPKQSEIEAIKQEKFYVDIEQNMNSKDFLKYTQKAIELIDKFGATEAVASLLSIINNNKSKSDSFNNNSQREKRGNDREDYNSSRNKTSNRKNNGDVRLFVAKGKMDGFHKGTLLGYLEKEANLKFLKGKEVKVCEKFSFLTVSANDANSILDVFESKKGRPLVEVASK